MILFLCRCQFRHINEVSINILTSIVGGMVVAKYLTDQVKSDRVLKKLATHVLCFVKIWMNVDEQRTDEVD